MKLLLTSAGISNKSIHNALVDLRENLLLRQALYSSLSEGHWKLFAI
jgi:hypothetical protein